MNDFRVFLSILNLMMCDDPSNLKDEERKRLEIWADEEAKEFGFLNWIDAYHGVAP